MQRQACGAADASQASLVNSLISNKYITSAKVQKTMLKVDRKFYSPSDPYADSPQKLTAHATISAPHMHAKVLELMKDQLMNGNSCLDVGSGSGYLLACMKLMVGKQGTAVGIDIDDALVTRSKYNIRMNLPEFTGTRKFVIEVGDGKLGYPSKAPFNAIHVGAAASVLPMELIRQLAIEGILVIPIKDRHNDQWLHVCIRTSAGEYTDDTVCKVRYVPLV